MCYRSPNKFIIVYQLNIAPSLFIVMSLLLWKIVAICLAERFLLGFCLQIIDATLFFTLSIVPYFCSLYRLLLLFFFSINRFGQFMQTTRVQMSIGDERTLHSMRTTTKLWILQSRMIRFSPFAIPSIGKLSSNSSLMNGVSRWEIFTSRPSRRRATPMNHSPGSTFKRSFSHFFVTRFSMSKNKNGEENFVTFFMFYPHHIDW